MNKIMLTLTGAAALAAMSMPTGAEEPWAERVIVEHVDQGKLIGTLDDDDDVQNVYANFEVSDEVMAKLSA